MVLVTKANTQSDPYSLKPHRHAVKPQRLYHTGKVQSVMVSFHLSRSLALALFSLALSLARARTRAHTGEGAVGDDRRNRNADACRRRRACEYE